MLRRFGAFWFFAGFLPISNIVELNATSAEHWLYLPLAGLLVVCLGWAIELPPRGLRWAPALVVAFAVALGVRSASRSSDWLNAQVFYERTVAAGGWSPRIGLNLAVIYGDQGRLQESRSLLDRTLAVRPGYPQAQSYLGVIMARQGAKAESDRVLAKAAAPSPDQTEYPRSWVAAVQLARRHVELAREDEALRVLGAAREREPNVWALARMQADILQKTNRADAALQVVQKFTDENWWQYSAFLALGKLKAQQDDAPAALAALKHASRLDIRETEALNMIVRIQMRAKNLTAAHAVQRRAVSRQPDEPSQYMLFSEVLMEMGRTEEARRARETAELLQQTARASA